MTITTFILFVVFGPIILLLHLVGEVMIQALLIMVVSDPWAARQAIYAVPYGPTATKFIVMIIGFL